MTDQVKAATAPRQRKSKGALPRFEILKSTDGGRVWVNGPDGSAIGRFNKRTGIDVHTTATAQQNGAPECLHCTHGEATVEDWRTFCQMMKAHYDIDVPFDLLAWEEQKIDLSKIKLTPAQSKVMKWLGKKWTAYPSGTGSFTVNGKRLCTQATMTSLEKAGLVVKTDHGGYTGTEAGRELTAARGL